MDDIFGKEVEFEMESDYGACCEACHRCNVTLDQLISMMLTRCQLSSENGNRKIYC